MPSSGVTRYRPRERFQSVSGTSGRYAGYQWTMRLGWPGATRLLGLGGSAASAFTSRNCSWLSGWPLSWVARSMIWRRRASESSGGGLPLSLIRGKVSGPRRRPAGRISSGNPSFQLTGSLTIRVVVSPVELCRARRHQRCG